MQETGSKYSPDLPSFDKNILQGAIIYQDLWVDLENVLIVFGKTLETAEYVEDCHDD